MSLQNIAQHLANQGRGKDTTLVHMTPNEVSGLEALARAKGGQLTINPETGLPEAGFLEDLLPTVIGGALSVMTGGAITPLMAGLGVGAVSGLASGNLGKGLMAGLGAYGGAGLTEGLTGLGAAQIGSKAAESAVSDAATKGLTGEAYNTAVQQSVADRMAGATMSEKIGAGLSSAFENPRQAIGAIGSKTLAAAASPIFAGQIPNEVQTTTPRPTANRGYIRPHTFDPVTQRYTAGEPYAAAKGGLMSLAKGGIVNYADGGIASNSAINDMYQSVLGRAADPSGAAFWAQQFGSEIDPKELAAFQQNAAPEIAARQAAATGTTAIPTTKEGFFDATSGAYYPGIAASLDKASPITDAVQDLYKNVLDRKADQAGMDYWATRFGPTLEPEEAAQFKAMAAPEVAARQSSTSGTGYKPISSLNDLYMQELGRPGEQAGMDFWRKTFGEYIDPTELAGFKEHAAREKALRKLPVAPVVPAGASGQTGPGQTGGGTVINPNGTITTSPNIPGIPVGGFTGMKQVRDAYTAGGGSLGYIPYAPKTMDEFYAEYKNTGDSKAMYDYLMGKGPYPTKTGTADVDASGNKIYREPSKPYSEVMGAPANPNKQYTWNQSTGQYTKNPDYVKQIKTYDPTTKQSGMVNYMSINQAKAALAKNPLAGNALADWAILNNVDADTLAEATGMSWSEVNSLIAKAKADKALPAKEGGLMALANGGLAQSSFADGGQAKEYVDSTGAKHIWDFSNGIYRPETMVKSGVTYKWNPAAGKYEVSSGNAGVDVLMNNQTGGGQDAAPSNPANADWGSAYGIGKALSSLGLAGIGNTVQEAATNGMLGQSNVSARAADAMASTTSGLPQGFDTKASSQQNAEATQAAQAQSAQTADAMANAMSGAEGPSPGERGGEQLANGGMTGYAGGGLGSLGGYSDGGQLLRGPGDGVSDNIPATIGGKQPARLADGEFILPARIVSELGNGSTEAGARALYKMMDRIQKNRRKTVGKGRVAVDSKSHKYLPA